MASSMKVAFSLALFVSMAHTDLRSECDMAGFYLELGCTPAPSPDNTTCPTAFTCPELHPDPKLCYYRGVGYPDRAKIPQEVVRNPCSLDCVCDASTPAFSCAAVDCVENFNADERQQCINTYDDIGSCCATGNVCGKDAIAQLSTCEVDGQSYREGQTFQPSNSSKTCLCTSQWNNSVDSPDCRDLHCGVEIHNQKSLMMNCAPVYFEKARNNCPISFECPSATTKLVSGVTPATGSSAQCAFGDMRLSVGDEVTVEDKCTKCTCAVPPFVTCLLTICY